MRKIISKIEYIAIKSRVEELLLLVDNDTPPNTKDFIELDLLSDLMADYEESIEEIKSPSLIEVIQLRMYEMSLSQLKLSELIGVSPSRVSEYLMGKSEPPLKVAREISKKLNISASVVLGI